MTATAHKSPQRPSSNGDGNIPLTTLLTVLVYTSRRRPTENCDGAPSWWWKREPYPEATAKTQRQGQLLHSRGAHSRMCLSSSSSLSINLQQQQHCSFSSSLILLQLCSLGELRTISQAMACVADVGRAMACVSASSLSACTAHTAASSRVASVSVSPFFCPGLKSLSASVPQARRAVRHGVPLVVDMAKREEELVAIRKMSDEDINQTVVDLKGELFLLRTKQATRQEYKSSEFRRIHKNVRDGEFCRLLCIVEIRKCIFFFCYYPCGEWRVGCSE